MMAFDIPTSTKIIWYENSYAYVYTSKQLRLVGFICEVWALHAYQNFDWIT